MTSLASSTTPDSTTQFAALTGQRFGIPGSASDTPKPGRRPLRTRSYGITDVGRKRRRNEDCLGYDDQEGIYAVADGIGGGRHGDLAARLAVEALLESVGSSDQVDCGLTDRLEQAMHRAHARIRDEASKGRPSLQEMGTTLVSLLVESSFATVAHVGDSRCYLLRGGELKRLTQDHTLGAEIATMGRTRPEGGERPPLSHVLTRALSPESDLVVDSAFVPIQAGDVFLLCSDGLTDMLRDAEICDALKRGGGPEEMCQRLVCEALTRGGYDNVTALVVEVVE